MGVAGAPVGHVAQNRQQVAAFAGELVVMVYFCDDGVLLEALEALREGTGVDVGDSTFDLTITPRAGCELTEDESGPFGTEYVGGAAEATEVVG